MVVFDDMRVAADWRQGRVERVQTLRSNLLQFPALRVSELDVGSGLVLAVKGDTPPTRKGRAAPRPLGIAPSGWRIVLSLRIV